MRLRHSYIVCCLLLLSMVSACTEDHSSQKDSRMITFQAAVPDNTTRAGLVQQSATLDLIARWRDGESISLFVFQEGKSFSLSPAPISNISDDGKHCSFTIELPDEVSLDKPYDIYGLCGIDGEIDSAEGKVYAKSRMWRERFDDRDVTAPMWFHATGGAQSIAANFKHLGTYEVLHVENNTDARISFSHQGFDVQNPWYKYEDNTLLDDAYDPSQSSSVPGEAESGNITIEAHGSCTIYSWYIPSGSSISEAKLKASIDGSSVVSANAKSSTLQIKRGHAYHQYVTWDGTELIFKDGMEETVVLDVTDPDASGINVVDIDNDGTMTIESSEDNAPKVGDILCSGPTELAPYGYMLRVTEVTKVSAAPPTRSWDDIQMYIFIIKTAGAALNEVISNFHYSKHVNFNDVQIDQVTDREGNKLQLIEERPKEWKVPITLNFGSNLTVKPVITFKPKDLVFYVDVKDKEFQKFGADMEMDVDVSVQIDAKLDAKFEKSISLFYIFLKPIPICAEPPIVITPLFQVYLTFKADGHIKVSCVPVNTSYKINAGACYDFQQGEVIPSSGGSFYTVSQNKDNERTVGLMQGGLTLNGSVSASLGASLSFGIDGCNYVGRADFLGNSLDVLADMASVDFNYELNTIKFSTKVGIDNIEPEAWSDFHFYDECKLENYERLSIQFFLRVWNPFRGEFVGFDPTPVDIIHHHWEQWDDHLYPTLFVPDFTEMSATLREGNIKLNAKRYKPYFGNTLFKENGYGFRYGKYVSSENRVTNWTNLSDVSVIGNADDPVWNISRDLPVSNLEEGVTYCVCPYSYVLTPVGTYTYIHRKGLFFRVNSDGTLSYNELPNIPGMDL